MARVDLPTWLGVFAIVGVAATAVVLERSYTQEPAPSSSSAYSYAPPAPPFPFGTPSALSGPEPASSAVGGGPPSTSTPAAPAAAMTPARPATSASTSASASASSSASVAPSASSSASATASATTTPTSASPPGVNATLGAPPFPITPPATILVTMAGSDAESTWTSIMPFVRGGDLVIAHIGGSAGLAAESWVGFGDRVHADRPLVGFVLAVDDPARLEVMATQGLPASATAVGYGTPDGWSADALALTSTAIRSAGKRMFVTTTTTPGAVGYNEIGQRADLVELRARSADPTALALEVDPVARALRATGAPFIYVQPPPSLATTADDVSAVTGAIIARTPGVGISLPATTPVGVLAELRPAR